MQADVGDGNEFRYIIVAVVGGNLLTGGYGSALGAGIGALIWGMISQGIGFAQWNSDWRFLVLGALLLVAVLVNNYVRGRAEKAPVKSSATRPDRNRDHHHRAQGPSGSKEDKGMSTQFLELRNLSKFYGNIIALTGVTTTVNPGEVTCVLGDNGAGKSTFIKILAGVHQHDEENCSWRAPR